ncbi:DUF4432 family protein [Cohnella soli]|uniref:DUF4432 family protein n=1 Tax=Cohnella soli TaxID=425005 RepID=A0ABW0HYY7_9BACL
MPTITTIRLETCRFEREPALLLEHGGLCAHVFRYRSGVCAVKLTNAEGNLVVLPYQGQQIWSMDFAGRSLAMKSTFDEPQETRDFLSTYGAFLLHCGMRAMGNPGKADDHPVHGELPNAPFQDAWLRAGEDTEGAYLEIGGSYRHTLAFTCDYRVETAVRLYEQATTVRITVSLTNLRSEPLEYMYLAHLNFRPVDYGRLVYSAPNGEGQVGMRQPNPELISRNPAYGAFIDKVAKNPALIDVLDPTFPINPEIVLNYRYVADEEGWAHSMQVRPDGYADYVKHRPDELPQVVRWIARTGHEQALGLALPATATAEGYSAEKRKGNVRQLASHQSISFHYEAGLLSPEQTADMERRITSILNAEDAERL